MWDDLDEFDATWVDKFFHHTKGIMLILIILIAGGAYYQFLNQSNPSGPVNPVVNPASQFPTGAFNHTRTPIFNQTSVTTGPSGNDWQRNSTCVGVVSANPVFGYNLSYSSGFPVGANYGLASNGAMCDPLGPGYQLNRPHSTTLTDGYFNTANQNSQFVLNDTTGAGGSNVNLGGSISLGNTASKTSPSGGSGATTSIAVTLSVIAGQRLIVQGTIESPSLSDSLTIADSDSNTYTTTIASVTVASCSVNPLLKEWVFVGKALKTDSLTITVTDAISESLWGITATAYNGVAQVYSPTTGSGFTGSGQTSFTYSTTFTTIQNNAWLVGQVAMDTCTKSFTYTYATGGSQVQDIGILSTSTLPEISSEHIATASKGSQSWSDTLTINSPSSTFMATSVLLELDPIITVVNTLSGNTGTLTYTGCASPCLSGNAATLRAGICTVAQFSGTASEIDFYLGRNSGLTGTVTAELYSTTGTIAAAGTCASLSTLLATSTTTINISTLPLNPSAPSFQAFLFTSGTITSGQKYIAVIQASFTNTASSSMTFGENTVGDAGQAHVDNFGTTPQGALAQAGNNIDEFTCGGVTTCEAYNLLANIIIGAPNAQSAAGQAFITWNSFTLASVQLDLAKVGAPFGPMTAQIWGCAISASNTNTQCNGSPQSYGTTSIPSVLLATSTSVDASTLTTSFVMTTFSFVPGSSSGSGCLTFTGSSVFLPITNCVIPLNLEFFLVLQVPAPNTSCSALPCGIDSSNYIKVGIDSLVTQEYHDGNSALQNTGTIGAGWTAQGAREIFQIGTTTTATNAEIGSTNAFANGNNALNITATSSPGSGLWSAVGQLFGPSVLEGNTSSANNINNCTSRTNCDLQFVTNHANDLIIIFAATQTTAQTATIADKGSGCTGSGSLSFTTRVNGVTNNGVKVYEWWAISAQAYTNTNNECIRVTWSAVINSNAVVFAISGVNTVTPFDANGGFPVTATGATGSPSATITTNSANDMIIGYATATTQQPTSGTGFSQIGSLGSPAFSAAEVKQVTAIQSSATVTFTSSSTAWEEIADAVVLTATPSFDYYVTGLRVQLNATGSPTVSIQASLWQTEATCTNTSAACPSTQMTTSDLLSATKLTGTFQTFQFNFTFSAVTKVLSQGGIYAFVITATGAGTINGSNKIFVKTASSSTQNYAVYCQGTGCTTTPNLTKVAHSVVYQIIGKRDYLSGAGVSFNPNGVSNLKQATFNLKKVGTTTGIANAVVYLASGGLPTGSAIATSVGLDISTLTTSYVVTTFTFNATNQPVLTHGQSYFIAVQIASNAVVDNADYVQLCASPVDGGASFDSALDGGNGWQQPIAGGAVTNVGPNFSSTANPNPPSKSPLFSVTGNSAFQGNNCNSADIILSPIPVNLQTVQGKQLEILWGFDGIGWTTATLPDLYFFLRQNNTLPSFNQGYSALTDPANKLIWQVCTAPRCANGNNTIMIVHDPTKSVSQEGILSDTIISIPATQWASQEGLAQTVLNYTGGVNYLASIGCCAGSNNNGNSTKNVANQLNPNQLYYIGFQAIYQNGAPNAGETSEFLFNICGNVVGGCKGSTMVGSPALPATMYIVSVPSVCDDPANITWKSSPCNNPAAGQNNTCPTSNLWCFFVFNPLDTLGNALGAGNIGTQFLGGINSFGGGVYNAGSNLFVQGIFYIYGNAIVPLGQLVIAGMNAVVDAISVAITGKHYTTAVQDIAAFLSVWIGQAAVIVLNMTNNLVSTITLAVDIGSFFASLLASVDTWLSTYIINPFSSGGGSVVSGLINLVNLGNAFFQGTTFTPVGTNINYNFNASGVGVIMTQALVPFMLATFPLFMISYLARQGIWEGSTEILRVINYMGMILFTILQFLFRLFRETVSFIRGFIPFLGG